MQALDWWHRNKMSRLTWSDIYKLPVNLNWVERWQSWGSVTGSTKGMTVGPVVNAELLQLAHLPEFTREKLPMLWIIDFGKKNIWISWGSSAPELRAVVREPSVKCVICIARDPAVPHTSSSVTPLPATANPKTLPLMRPEWDESGRAWMLD